MVLSERTVINTVRIFFDCYTFTRLPDSVGSTASPQTYEHSKITFDLINNAL
jgi:hypothetical protein